MDRLSGDQNGMKPPSVPARAWTPKPSSRRIQISRLPSAPVAEKASIDPSGDNAIELHRSRSICGGKSIEDRVTGVSTGRCRRRPAANPSAASRSAAAQGAQARRRRADDAPTGAGTPLAEPPSAIHLSSLFRSAAFCQRSSGSFARQRLTTRSSGGGVVGAIAEIGAGSSFMIEEISEAWLAPENAFFPVAIS